MILILNVGVGSLQNYHLGKNHGTTVVLRPVFNKFSLVSVGFSFAILCMILIFVRWESKCNSIFEIKLNKKGACSVRNYWKRSVCKSFEL